MTPVDLNLYKTVNLQRKLYEIWSRNKKTTEEQKKRLKNNNSRNIKNNGLDINVIKDITEIPIYAADNLTWEGFFGDKIEEVKAEFPSLAYGSREEIVKVSDYNKIAKLYGIEEYQLNDNEYIMLCEILIQWKKYEIKYYQVETIQYK